MAWRAMRRSRETCFVALASAAVLVGACSPATPAATSEAPTVELTPVPGGITAPPVAVGVPIDEDWHGKTLHDAVAALGTLKSYQFASRTQLGNITGVVVNDDPPRYSIETSAMLGGPPIKAVVIGNDQFVSYGGGVWSRIPSDGSSVAGSNPFQSTLPVGFNDIADDPTGGGFPLPAFVDAGIEDHEGVQSRHIRAAGDGKVHAGPNDPSFDGSEVFQGTVDAWISVDDGYLVGLKIKGKWVEQDAMPTESPPFNLPFDFNDASADIAVRHVNEVGNAVEEPSIPPETPRPSGHPEVIAMLGGLRDALKDVPAYRYESTGGSGAIESRVSLVIANTKPRRMHLTMDTGSMGLKSEIIVIGNEGWQRTNDGDWQEVAASELTGCFDGMPIDQCGDMTSSFDQAITGAPETYEQLAEHETIDGIETIHLHSDSGITMADQSLPGVSDVWVAADGGYLVREIFASDFLNMQNDVRPLKDSDVKVDRPVP